MDYLKTYKRFIYGHYLASGVRITVGIVLPAFIMNYFGLLDTGLVMALGAMCVSGADNPGPIKYRRNGMLICTALTFVTALLTGLAAPYPIFMGIMMVIFCFVFSMIGVYGLSANTIGLSALLIMVLNIEQDATGPALWWYALYLLAGGLWYTLLSLTLYSFRPYKLAQQALGDCILATSDYLRTRAAFYRKGMNEEQIYKQVLEQQIIVHEKQELVRELLFKSQNIVKSSTHIGRTLLIMFLDTVDLMEKVMASYYDYKTLHQSFKESDIMHRYRRLALLLAQELDEIGIAVQSGQRAIISNQLPTVIKETRSYLAGLKDKKSNAENLAVFIQLRHILQGMEDIAAHIHRLQLYTTYDKSLAEQVDTSSLQYDKFITQQDVSPKLLLENFTFKSDIFRHALRVSIAIIIGYIISQFLTIGHSYWILLTIIVILKPNYSLTQKRNRERLLGTIGGALIGLIILYFIKERTTLFVIMLFLMTGTFASLRPNYMVGVIFMTPYILILFHLLYGSNTKVTFTDRVIDTAIGSVIAFLANIFLVPAWEQEQMKKYITEMINNNNNYFKDVSAALTGDTISTSQYKLSRKNAFVSLANLSDAFSRMLMEPKSKQKNIRELHQFVVLNHMLTSHIATLSRYINRSNTISEKSGLSQDSLILTPEESQLIRDRLDFIAGIINDINKVSLKLV